jgi:hypothetical protein
MITIFGVWCSLSTLPELSKQLNGPLVYLYNQAAIILAPDLQIRPSQHGSDTEYSQELSYALSPIALGSIVLTSCSCFRAPVPLYSRL